MFSKTQITTPIAKDLVKKRILKQLVKLKKEGTLISGIKACVKQIKLHNKIKDKINRRNNEKDIHLTNKIFICNSNITHIDLISHIPILCERASIPYVFISDSDTPNVGYTCFLLTFGNNDEDLKKYQNIKKYCSFIEEEEEEEEEISEVPTDIKESNLEVANK